MSDKTLEDVKLLGKCNVRVLRQTIGTAIPSGDWVAINSETHEIISKRHWEGILSRFPMPQGWVKVPTRTIRDYLEAIPIEVVVSGVEDG